MLYEIVRKSLLAGLGMQEKVKTLVDELVKKGELSEKEGAKLMKEWVDKAEASKKDVGKMLTEGSHVAYDKLNIATKEELHALTKKVQQVSVRLKKLEDAVKQGGE